MLLFAQNLAAAAGGVATAPTIGAFLSQVAQPPGTQTVALTTAARDTTGGLNSTVLVMVGVAQGRTSALTDNKGNTYTLLTTGNRTSQVASYYIWHCKNFVGGAGHTWTNTSDAITAQGISVLEVKGTNGQFGANTGLVLDTAAPFTAGTTSTTSNSLLVSLLSSNLTGLSAPFTFLSGTSGINYSTNIGYVAAPTPGAYSTTISTTSSDVLSITLELGGVAAAGAGASTLKFDFNEAAGTALAAIDPRWQGAGAATIKATGSGAVGLPAFGGGITWFVAGQGVDQAAEAVIRPFTRGGGENPGVVLQASASQTGYRIDFGSNGSLGVYRNGAFVVSLGTGIPHTTTPTTLRASLIGGTITVTANGTVQGTYTDPTPLSGGYPGIFIGEGATSNVTLIESWTDLQTTAAVAPITALTVGTSAALTGAFVDVSPFSVAAPVGLLAGDIWFVGVSYDTNGSTILNTPAGWTAASATLIGTVDGQKSHLFYKTAVGGETSQDFTFSATPSSLDTAWVSLRVSGSAGVGAISTSLNDTVTAAPAANGGTLTPQASGSTALWLAFTDFRIANTSTVQWTAPTGYTGLKTFNDGNWNSLAVAYRNLTGTATETPTGGSATFVGAGAGTNGGSASWLVELKAPAVVLTPRRALYLTNGVIKVVPTNLLGTGLKPVVLVGGRLKQRATTEGAPVIILNGKKRTLSSTESLEI